MYSGKEFLSQYTVQQIMNGRFNRLCFERYCGITEHILRQIIEDWVECKKEVPDYFFHELGDVNVELILSGIPNIICRSQNLWTLTNSKDQTGCIYIYGDEFRLYTK
uniref:Cyclic nucleotide-binding domain-containing protein n=1 Tax=Heterorhabditis bacteriophora TaxID=37862 RepID=A0A1I7WJS0_HETBA